MPRSSMNCLGRPILRPVPPASTSAIADLKSSISGRPPEPSTPPLRELAGDLQVTLTFQAALDGAGACLADPLYLVELLLRRPEKLFERAELPDETLGDPARQARHTLELSVSARLDEQVLHPAVLAIAQGTGDLARIRELLGRQGPQLFPASFVVRLLCDVVPQQSFVLLGNAVEGLLELHLDQPALAAQLPHVSLYLFGDPGRVLEGTDGADYLPQRHGPVVLVHGQVPRLLPQPPGELLERCDGRVRLGQDHPDILEDVRTVRALVEAHHPPSLGDRYDEAARLLRRAVGRQVAHPGLLGFQGGVRAQLDVRVVDRRDVGRDHDRAVHLGELVEAHRREFHLDLHPARDDAETFELLGVVEDDQGPVVRPHDVLYGVPEIRARGQKLEGAGQLRRQMSPPGTQSSATATASSRVLTSTTLASLRVLPSVCSEPSDVLSGLIIRLKPILAISEVRRGPPAT